MTVELSRVIDTIDPQNTVLLFGAGSSIPSGAPSVADIVKHLGNRFKIPTEGYSLREIASLAEEYSRSALISELRTLFSNVTPTGGLLNLPLYAWKAVYTTNYDNLIEQCYHRARQALVVYSSDFDFTIREQSGATKLFKMHGTIEKDICDGNNSRIIISESDYDSSSNYRDALNNRFKGDLAGSDLVIIGQSLADPEIRRVADEAAAICARTQSAFRVSLLLYERDQNRAQLFERRGFCVCFGSINDFFAELASRKSEVPASTDDSLTSPLDKVPTLRPVTLDVEHASAGTSSVSAMFNGWPASHADIVSGLTFQRTVAEDIERYLRTDEALCAVILGASGVGKTTAGRQALQALRRQQFLCWEHSSDHKLDSSAWVRVSKVLDETSAKGALLIDEAHIHLHDINDLIDGLITNGKPGKLKLIFISTRSQWNPRIKTPYIFKYGKQFRMWRLHAAEIERLLNLVDTCAPIRTLVEDTFAGFSRYERRRRLVERCESETFVCLKNIFASEKFDDIILREYASLAPEHQDIYRHVAAMESSGIRVHRQLVMRLLGLPADEVSAALTHLTDIVHEYTINEREGLYGWQGRHSVIVNIIAKYKYADVEKLTQLFSHVIDCINPTYDIEIRTLQQLCNLETGLPRIPDKQVINFLLRKMMSVAPGERVPRHRLIRNLIQMGEFEKAETEIRIFEKDFRRDGPIARYKVQLLIARARHTEGILEEDRIAILEEARSLAIASIQRFPFNRSLLAVYGDLGIEVFKRTKRFDVYDDAVKELRLAEDRLGDPEIGRLLAHYERRMLGQTIQVGHEIKEGDGVLEELTDASLREEE